MTWDPDRYQRALAFAAAAHGEQRLPDSTLPYVVHLADVAMEVMTACAGDPGLDADLAVQCALLHDTVEDAGVTADDLRTRFGEAVTRGVLALTKDARLPKGERMADSLRRIAAGPREVGMVKLADRITNLQPPPRSWGPEKIDAYREEAKQILTALGASHRGLAERLRVKIEGYGRGGGEGVDDEAPLTGGGAAAAARPAASSGRRLVEIRSYTLRPESGARFHALVHGVSVALQREWGIDVVAYGQSVHAPDAYYLIRAFRDQEHLKTSQAEFYASEAWKKGPRQAIVELITADANAVFWTTERAVDALRRR